MLGARRSPVTPSADTCVATALCPASEACTGAWPRAAALAGTGLALGPVGVGGRVSGAPWRSRLSLAGRVASGSAVCLSVPYALWGFTSCLFKNYCYEGPYF